MSDTYPEFAVEATIDAFSYPDNVHPVLENINLKIRTGEFVGIVGASGVGKTSLLLTLCGAIPHAIQGDLKGDIRIWGIDTKNAKLSELSQKVGMLLQDPESQLFNLTVEEDVAFGAQNLCIPRDQLLENLNNILIKMRLFEERKRSSWELSGGQKQAAALAGIMIMEPKVLLLDEPTSELDPIGSRTIFNLVDELHRDHQITVIMVEHKLEELTKVADRMILVESGKITVDAHPRNFFDDVDHLGKTGVRPPAVALVAQRLRKEGVFIERIPLTLEEAVEVFKPLCGKHPPIATSRNLNRPSRSIGENVVEVGDLWHIYPGNVEAIRGVTFDVTSGEMIAIIGQNGSGKTTLAKHLNGLLRPSQGTVKISGIDTRNQRIAELAHNVGYVFQNPDHQLFKDSLIDEVSFGPKNLGWQDQTILNSVREAFRNVELDFPNAESIHPYSLSKGQRQRLALAGIIAMKPKVIIVDEPTTGQDRYQSTKIMEIMAQLNRKGHTIITITHDMDLVLNYAKRVILMYQGTILADGSPEEVFMRKELLEKADIVPPQIVELGQLLGADTIFWNSDDALRFFGINPIHKNETILK